MHIAYFVNFWRFGLTLSNPSVYYVHITIIVFA
mgnify:FL=1